MVVSGHAACGLQPPKAASEEAAPNERVRILDFWKVYTRPFEILRKFILDLLHILKFDGISFFKSHKKRSGGGTVIKGGVPSHLDPRFCFVQKNLKEK